MNTPLSIEQRVEILEASLSRTRRLAISLAILLLMFASAAFVRQEDEIRTSKLVLMESEQVEGIALVAGPESSLILQTPAGGEIMRLGGDPLRIIGEDPR